ncbi:MAG: DUF2202 domain-containing protein [Anaerolineae bacterium]
MFKKLLFGSAAIAIMAAGLGCAPVPADAGGPLQTRGAGPAVVYASAPLQARYAGAALAADSPALAAFSLSAIQQSLDAAEQADLLYMREEEKLARDVYQAFYELWGQPTFANIAAGEQQHMDAMLTLLERYGLPDPAAGTAAGEFTNADLQSLYTALVAQGSQSLADALRVGAAIEEIDVRDLRAALTNTTRADIQQAYTNLELASGNHLRAFTRVLASQTGESYVPQYLDQEAYDALMSAGNTSGRAR